MATMTEPQAPTGMPRAGDGTHRSGSRFARWRASWGVALRMARRDLRRHKGRAVLVFLMVAIPVAIIAGAATLGATSDTDSVDRTTAIMGSAQALVQGPQVGKLQQTPDPNEGGMGWDSDNPATVIPGYSSEGSTEANSRALGALVGGTAVPIGETQVRFVQGERRIRITGMVLDPRGLDLGTKASLSSGSWGTTADEIVITPSGERKGLPRSGTVTLSAGGTERPVRVVGTGTGWLEYGGQPDIIVPSMPAGAGADASGVGAAGSWLVLRSTPVTWTDVQHLNTYGLTVFSRQVLENPPPDSALPPELRPRNEFVQDTGRMIAVLGGVMLFIITTLLVGPAFAVSASRQRRTLALAATNGAEVRQLRRTVLAQAVVLGVISAIGGCVLGLVAVRAGLWWWSRTHPASSFASVPLDIPWTAIAILLPCALLSAVVAALLPSLRLGRLDIIGVMRGQSVSPPLNKVLPVVGVILAAIGGYVVISGTRFQAGGDLRIVGGAIALVGGTLLVVPALLAGAGRLATRLPVATRMATRDAARHRSRSTPTVAAILAGVAALTAFSIGLASDTKQQIHEYVPRALPGEGTIYTSDAETRLSVAAALKQVGNAVQATPLSIVRGAEDPLGVSGPSSKLQPFVAALLDGCTVDEAITETGPDARCPVLGTMVYNGGFIGVLPAKDIASRLHLDTAQLGVLEAGGVVAAVPALQAVPSIRVTSGTFVMDQSTYAPADVKTTRTDELRVAAVPSSNRANGAMPEQIGAFVTPETAKRLGWPSTQIMVLLHSPDGGAIDRATEQQLDELVGDEGGLYVERGFQRYDEMVMRIMMGAAAVLVLIVTLISTALSLAEQQGDLGTLAAVGATRRTRRGFAAAQAVVTGLIGSALGIAVGLVPGIAISYPLTVQGEVVDLATGGWTAGAHYLSIPWVPLVAVVVGVPLVAGAIAAAAIRRAPMVTRRAD